MKEPSKALLDDLKGVFEKHNWPGHAIGITMSAYHGDHEDNSKSDAGHDCPPGQTWKPYYIQKPDGTVVFGYHCA